MKRLKKLFRQPGFHTLLFFFFFTLFSWPLLTIPGNAGLLGLFIYLFLVWGIVVFLLFLINRNLNDDASDETRKDEGVDGNV